MPLNVSWKIPTILHVNHSLCPSPMVCPEFERDFLLSFIFQIFPQHTTHDFIHLAEAGENVNKACVWISRCSCLAPKSMLNHKTITVCWKQAVVLKKFWLCLIRVRKSLQSTVGTSVSGCRCLTRRRTHWIPLETKCLGTCGTSKQILHQVSAATHVFYQGCARYRKFGSAIRYRYKIQFLYLKNHKKYL